MKKRSFIYWGWLIVITLFPHFFYGCTSEEKKNQSTQGVEVILKITREHYEANNLSTLRLAYRIDAEVTNKTSKNIEFDSVDWGFIPSSGKLYEVRTYHYTTKTDGSSGRANRASPYILAPGQIEKYNFSSDGYTWELIRDTGKEPLKFGMIIMLEDKQLYKIPLIELPPVGDLPYYDMSRLKRDKEPMTVKFIL